MKRGLAIAVCTIMLMLGLTGCGERVAMTADAFVQAVGELGYTAEKTDSVDGTETYVLANDEETSLSFVVSAGEKEALVYELFDNTVSSFEEAHTTVTMSLSASASNWEYYHATGGEEFLILCRVDNTLLCSVSTPEHAKELKGLFEELGYK